MSKVFDLSLDFMGDILSLEGAVNIGAAVLAIIVLYLVVAKYAESAKNIVKKTLPSFGFSPDETALFSEIAPGLVKTAGFATMLLIAGRHIPLIGAATEIGNYILTVIGYAITLTLAAAVVLLARSNARIK
jgi:hypothetical protein